MNLQSKSRIYWNKRGSAYKICPSSNGALNYSCLQTNINHFELKNIEFQRYLQLLCNVF